MGGTSTGGQAVMGRDISFMGGGLLIRIVFNPKRSVFYVTVQLSVDFNLKDKLYGILC